ncbi:MAG TPA: DUF697 domain-containing protein [Opitutus sp.]|nr:DUF697 domain-containing protein [Opitutus sp.]
MATAVTTSSHAIAATAIVREHAALAMVASMVPVPFAEFAAVSAVHLRMIEDLSREYGVDFRPQRARALVTALLSGYASYSLDSFLVGSLAKFIPGLGSAVALITLPSITAALTYALGRIFIGHFERGGSLIDFDSARLQQGFLHEVERSRVHPAEFARIIGARAAATPRP